jgi:hypothetical protein
MGVWKVALVRTEDLVRRGENWKPGDPVDTSRLDEMAEWIRSLGGDLDHIAMPGGVGAAAALIAYDDAGQYQLHLSQHVLDEVGRPQLDYCSGNVVTRPVVLPIADGSWPNWIADCDNPGESAVEITIGNADREPLGWFRRLVRGDS